MPIGDDTDGDAVSELVVVTAGGADERHKLIVCVVNVETLQLPDERHKLIA